MVINVDRILAWALCVFAIIIAYPATPEAYANAGYMMSFATFWMALSLANNRGK